MSSIRLELSDWLYNAGIVGFINILNHSGGEVKILNNQCIEIDSDEFQGFEEKYFKYFTEKYLKLTSWYKIVNFKGVIERLDVDALTDKDIKLINDYIEDIKKKIKSNSYISAYKLSEDNSIDILQLEKELKKITLKKKDKLEDKEVKDKVKNTLNKIEEIIDYLNKDSVKRYVLTQIIIYDVICKFIGKVSFLNPNNIKNGCNMYEEYKEYFLDSANNYLTLNKSKDKYNCFTCSNTLSKLSKPIAYELAWLNKMGVDMSRKSSHFWNFNGDSYICPICNLIYSCIPAGFTVLKGKGIFINENSGIKTLISINNQSLDNIASTDELEELTYFNLSDTISHGSIEHSQREIDNIQIIKLDSKNESRPYTFNILSKDKLRIISKYKDKLKYMIKVHIKISKDEYLNLYNEVLNRLYNGRNMFDLIYKLYYLNLNKEFKSISHIENILKINRELLKGGGTMEDKVIDNCKSFGYYLRKAYEERKSENKLGGISYRLLNALKTKNTTRFMDTLFNAYMYLNAPIPSTFIEALKDKDNFQTIGYAFLLGIQSGDIKDKNKGEVVNG